MQAILFVKKYADMTEEERATFREAIAEDGAARVTVGDTDDPDDVAFFEQFVPFSLSEPSPETFVIDTSGFCNQPITLHAATKFTVYDRGTRD